MNQSGKQSSDDSDHFLNGCVWFFAILPYGIVIVGLMQGDSPLLAALFVVAGFPLFMILPAIISERRRDLRTGKETVEAKKLNERKHPPHPVAEATPNGVAKPQTPSLQLPPEDPGSELGPPTFGFRNSDGTVSWGGGGRVLPPRRVTCKGCHDMTEVDPETTEFQCKKCGQRNPLPIILF